MAPLIRVPAWVMLAALVCGEGLAQVDLTRLEVLYLGLQSGDRGTRYKAAEAIQENEEFLKYPETASRLLDLLVLETGEIQRMYGSGVGYGEGWGELYSSLLGTCWELWKEKLTPRSFRAFAEATYGAGSRFAKELGSRAGRFPAELVSLTEASNAFVRANGVALAGYALLEDETGGIRLAPGERAALMARMAAVAGDADIGVWSAAVRVLKVVRGDWAIPILEKMRAGGTGSRQYRGEIEEALRAVRSRGEMPGEDFDRMQAIYRDMRSGDAGVREKAFRALAERDAYLEFWDTPDRLVDLVALETQLRRGGGAAVESAEGRAWYETLLGTTWEACKDRLEFRWFRVLLEAVYSPFSGFARELSLHAGRFSTAVLMLARRENPAAMRENAVAVMSYALDADEAGSARLTALHRETMLGTVAEVAADREPGMREAAVRILGAVGGAWAIPVLEKVREGRTVSTEFRRMIEEAIRAVRSRQ